MIKVLVFGQTLRDLLKENEMEFEIAGPMTVRAFLETNQEKLYEALSLAERGQLLISVNKKVATLETKLQEGDTLKLTHQAHFSYEGARWQNP